jgi:hypothetical protein
VYIEDIQIGDWMLTDDPNTVAKPDYSHGL